VTRDELSSLSYGDTVVVTFPGEDFTRSLTLTQAPDFYDAAHGDDEPTEVVAFTTNDGGDHFPECDWPDLQKGESDATPTT